jgi:hypothetical protein
LLSVVVIFSCKEDKTVPQKIEPEFSMSVAEVDEGHIFTVKTNLPDETALLTTLLNVDGNNIGQSKTTVKNGTAVFGPFANRNGKHAGQLTLVLTLPVFQQSDSAKKILGDKGENLAGPLLFELSGLVGAEQKFAVDLGAKPAKEKEMENSTPVETISTRLTFDTFKSMYNENADLFSIERIDEWTTKEGEKADVVSYSNEDRAFSIILSRNSPAYVQGVFYIFPPSKEQMETFQSLLRMYALILTFDPEVSPEIVPTFSMELLNNMGKKMVLNSGVEYMLQDVVGNFILSITLPK